MGRVIDLSIQSALYITIVFLSVVRSEAQQRVQFTQYMFDGMLINPAYAGANEALSLMFIQRSQWTGIDNAPKTQTLSAHTIFKRKYTGLGAMLIYDKIGVHKNLNASANYAYHLKMGDHSFLWFLKVS